MADWPHKLEAIWCLNFVFSNVDFAKWMRWAERKLDDCITLHTLHFYQSLTFTLISMEINSMFAKINNNNGEQPGHFMDHVGKYFWVKMKINFTKLISLDLYVCLFMQRRNELVSIHKLFRFDLTWPQYSLLYAFQHSLIRCVNHRQNFVNRILPLGSLLGEFIILSWYVIVTAQA